MTRTRRYLRTTVGVLGVVTVAALVAGVFMLLPGQAAAKKKPPKPPAGACAGLTGGALKTCTEYCEKRDCDVVSSPDCDKLRAKFQRETGSSVFPCDCHDVCEAGQPLRPACDPCAAAVCRFDVYCCTFSWDFMCVEEATYFCGMCGFCGDWIVTPPEVCDPPGSYCSTGFESGTCSPDCSTCIPSGPVCGDGIVQPPEQCDPPGTLCASGGLCQWDCTCGPSVCDPNQSCNMPIPCEGSTDCNSWVRADGGGCYCGSAVPECTPTNACGPGGSCPQDYTCVSTCCGDICVPACGSGPPLLAPERGGAATIRQR
jgi:hypothetical protein